jgi:hypothetical protein
MKTISFGIKNEEKKRHNIVNLYHDVSFGGHVFLIVFKIFNKCSSWKCDEFTKIYFFITD